MKKNNLLLCIALFSLFFLFGNVKAEELAKCVYDFSLNSITGKITCKVEETSVSCTTGNENLSVDTASVSLTPVNFQSGKTWKCPSTLYYDNGTNGAGGTAQRPALKNLNNVSGSVSASLNSSESSDGGNLTEETPIGDEKSYSCKYGSLVVTYSNNKINLSNSTCNSSSSFKASDFASGCPSRVWIYKYKNTCSYSISKGTAGGWVDLNGNDPVLDATGNDVSGEKKTTTSKKNETTSSNYTGCPLGADVTKDLYGTLKIFKIAAPLLVIAFTIFEFVQALAKGDITAELKKLSKRLLKRCVFAVILFFLPVLVNQVMQLANVWDENGTCDFSDEIQYNASDNNNNNNNSQNTSRDTQTKKDDYRQKNCDGYYNATTDECIKKSNVTCSTFSGEKSKCKNLSKDYGLSCEYNETNFKCSESSTVIEPSNTNNSIISDVSKFPKESLNCWKYGYDNCSGVCKWTGENSATGACRSKSEISSNIVESVCSLATDRDSCTSIDSYCEWTGYKCAPYTE